MGEACLYSDMTPTTTIAMISLARAAGVNHIIEEGREGGLSAFLYSLHGFQVTSVEYLPELEVDAGVIKACTFCQAARWRREQAPPSAHW